MKRLLVIGVVVGGMLASSAGASASHDWSGYHWARSTNPASLTVIDSVTSAWDASFLSAQADWSSSSVLDLSRVSGATGRKSRLRCNTSSGKIRVCNAVHGETGWLAITEIWIRDGHIQYGRVRLNDSYFRTPTYNTPEWRTFAACHEIGHTLGLDHQDEAFDNPNLGSCMDYTNDPLTNQHPNLHDYEQLEALYAHADGASATSANSSSSSQQSSNHSRRGWTSRGCEPSQQGALTKLTWTLPVL